MPKTEIGHRYILDGHKLNFHMDRVEAWERGGLIPPVTMDIALTTRCNAQCHFCAAAYQTGVQSVLPTDAALRLVEDAAEIGVRGMVLMSDGESTLHTAWEDVIEHGKNLGMDMAAASNGFLITSERAERVLPHLTYLRINFSAGEVDRYSQIMGVPRFWFKKVIGNIRYMVEFKRKHKLAVTININMVLHPRDADQVLPFARLGKELGVDYAIIKHCLDYSNAPLAVDYSEYDKIIPFIREAEALSTPDYLVAVKWRMIKVGGEPSCERCYGPQFLLQASGTGLLAACGPMFAPRYAAKYHIGNIRDTRLKDLWRSPRYREVMSYLQSDDFVATRDCRNYLCVQRHLNEALSRHLSGEERLSVPTRSAPEHINYI